jgi:hypothetical protein
MSAEQLAAALGYEPLGLAADVGRAVLELTGRSWAPMPCAIRVKVFTHYSRDMTLIDGFVEASKEPRGIVLRKLMHSDISLNQARFEDMLASDRDRMMDEHPGDPQPCEFLSGLALVHGNWTRKADRQGYWATCEMGVRPPTAASALFVARMLELTIEHSAGWLERTRYSYEPGRLDIVVSMPLSPMPIGAVSVPDRMHRERWTPPAPAPAAGPGAGEAAAAAPAVAPGGAPRTRWVYSDSEGVPEDVPEWSAAEREAFARRVAKHATMHKRAMSSAMELVDLWLAAPMTLG